MVAADQWVVVGLDNGATSNNATVLDAAGRFMVDRMCEAPSCVRDGPEQAVEALARADPAWLGGLISRRVPLSSWPEGLAREPGDVKVVVDLTQ